MRLARRRLLPAVPAAALAALAAALLVQSPASALSQGRAAARDEVTRQLGDHLSGERADRFVLDALRRAGVDPAVLGLIHVDPVAGVDLRAAVRAGKLDEIPQQQLSTRADTRGPAAGDLVAYADPRSGPNPARIRLGLMVTSAEVVLVNPREGGKVESIALGILDNTDAQRNLYADHDTVEVLRLVGEAWPGGDDVTEPPAGIALSDSGHIARGLAWVADHPRDTDSSPLHEAGKVLGLVLGGVVEGASWLLDHVITWTLSATLWLGRRLGPQGLALVALSTLLSSRFDGRGLHRALTFLVIGVSFGVLGLLAHLALRGIAAAGVPVLSAAAGAVTGAVYWTASELVSLVTGIDDSDRVSIAGIAVALASDALIFAKPLVAVTAVRTAGLAGRLLAHAPAPVAGALRGAGSLLADGWALLWKRAPVGAAAGMERALIGPRGAVATAGVIGDAATGKLSALWHLAQGHWKPTLEAPLLGGELGAGGTHTALALRGADALSWAWRPASIGSDAIGHGADLLQWLARHAPPAPAEAGRLAADLPVVDGARPRPLELRAWDGARRLLADPDALASIRRVEHLNRLHSGGVHLGEMAGGQGPVTASGHPCPFESPAPLDDVRPWLPSGPPPPPGGVIPPRHTPARGASPPFAPRAPDPVGGARG